MQKLENLTNQDNKKKNNINGIKNILLVYGNLDTGGIETLIIRTIKWFCKNNYLVTLFLYNREGDLIKYLRNLKRLKIIVYDYNSVYNKSFLSKNILKLPSKFFYELQISYLDKRYLRSNKYDLIYSFDPYSFLISYLFNGKISLSGVYHPKAYYIGSNKRYEKYLGSHDKDFTDKLMFMSESVKHNIEKYFHKKLKGGIFPLPVKIPKRREVLKGELNYKRFSSKKIISIGRIVDFKIYNFYMVDIIESLVKDYPEIEYHIYGYGALQNKLLEKIDKSTAKKNIFFHGKLNYSNMCDVLKDCFCFVGMGTSLIEACLFEIPGITAIAYDNKFKSHGFLYELPKYECGGLKDNKNPKYKVERLIRGLLNMPKDKYKLISQKCKTKAEEFDIENIMTDFMEYVNSLKEQPKIKRASYIKLFILRLLNFLDKK